MSTSGLEHLPEATPKNFESERLPPLLGMRNLEPGFRAAFGDYSADGGPGCKVEPMSHDETESAALIFGVTFSATRALGRPTPFRIPDTLSFLYARGLELAPMAPTSDHSNHNLFQRR